MLKLRELDDLGIVQLQNLELSLDQLVRSSIGDAKLQPACSIRRGSAALEHCQPG
jgi:hypothetical protein